MEKHRKDEENRMNKNMILQINESIVESFENWEGENILNYHKIYKRTWHIISWFAGENPATVQGMKKKEIETILQMKFSMSQMYMRGIDFLQGWEHILVQLEQKQKRIKKLDGNEDSFLECMAQVLGIAIYEEITEYNEAEWILQQDVFLKKVAGFIWLASALENKTDKKEIRSSVEYGLEYLDLDVERLFQKGIWKQIKNKEGEERLFYSLGILWEQHAHCFDKVCAFQENGIDYELLGRQLIERIIREELCQLWEEVKSSEDKAKAERSKESK